MVQYFVYYVEEGGYVRTDFSGEIDWQNSVGSIQEALELMDRMDTTRLLLDMRNARNVATTHENAAYQRKLSPRITRHTSADGARTVFLLAVGDRSHDVILASLKRRKRDIVVCYDEEHAIRAASMEPRERQ